MKAGIASTRLSYKFIAFIAEITYNIESTLIFRILSNKIKKQVVLKWILYQKFLNSTKLTRFPA